LEAQYGHCISQHVCRLLRNFPVFSGTRGEEYLVHSGVWTSRAFIILQRRPNPPLTPIPSQLWSAHAADDDPALRGIDLNNPASYRFHKKEIEAMQAEVAAAHE
jgi:hypothetical protein